MIARLRALFVKRDTASEIVDLNTAVQEVVALSLNELQRNGTSIRVSLAANLPYVIGDRVQLQQVVLNFILNAAESMAEVQNRAKEIVVSTERRSNWQCQGSGQRCRQRFRSSIGREALRPVLHD